MFGCTPLTDPNVQGQPNFFFEKINQKIKFSSQNCFSQNFKAWNLQKKKKKYDKNVFFFMKYSWQALLLCNKPFDLLTRNVFKKDNASGVQVAIIFM